MQWISAAEAARLLKVSRETLYAYVSRGFIRSEPVPGRPRVRRYAREDVERLRRRGEERRDPEKAASNALQWGMPILESSISLIASGRLYYRGHDVAGLARTRSIEEVASLIWTGAFDADFSATPLHVVAGGRSAEGLPFVTRAESMLPLVSSRDPLAFDLRPQAIAQTGWRIVNLLASIAAESSELEATIDATLTAHWKPRGARARDVLRAALIACADHELNVSAFTARCIASAGANPYSVVAGALCAIEGVKHGGATARVETLFDELRRARDPRRTIADRLRRGDSVEGFGHPLYKTGDPRATLLLDLLAEHYGKSKELALARQIAATAADVLGETPTVDFALVALQHTLRLPPGTALTLFAIGRSLGWIGHAIEQYQTGATIRPRAKYVGPMPG
jgi:citrate synthase